MKKLFSLLLVILISSSFLYSGERLLNKIMILVNGKPVSLFEMKKIINPDFPEKVSFEQILKGRSRYVDQVVEQILILEETEKRGVVISESELNAGIADVQRRNRMTREQLESYLKAKMGLTWDEYVHGVLKEQLKILRLKQMIASSTLEADEAVLRGIYEQKFSESSEYTASHIIMQARTQDEDQKILATLSSLYDEIKGGNISFEEAAKKFSQDGSAQSGGSLGTFPLRNMVPEFGEKLRSMKQGDISEPFRTRYGWHIVRLEKVEKKDPPKYEEVRGRILNIFYMENQEKAFKSWLKVAKESSRIEMLF